MQDQLDPVDGALESLRGRQWPGDYNNHELKDKLMQEFQTKRSSSPLGRHRMLAATLAVLLLGTAGFAAAGGVEAVRSWFITVELNGEQIDVELAEIVIDTEGDTTTMTVDLGELDVDVDGEATVTVTAIAQDLQGDIQPSASDAAGEETITINVIGTKPEDQE